MSAHIRTRSLSSRHLFVPSSSPSSSSPSSSPSPSLLASSFPSKLSFFSPRRLKALLQTLLALSIIATLLLCLAQSSPTGFSNSATAPAANAAADAFVHLKPQPPALAPSPAVDSPTGGEAPRPFSSPSPPSPPEQAKTSLLLSPLPRVTKTSNSPPWILSAPADQLPACEKILLFTFMPWWGFASEYILYVRAAAAAKRLGYTLVEDDRNWNYGRLSNYFLPRKLSCVPPKDWADHRKAYPLHQGSNWRGRPRLRYSRLILSNLDDWTRDEYLSSPVAKKELAALQKADTRHATEGDRWILEEGGTLPGVFEEVFEDQAGVMREWGMWRLKREVREQVDEVKSRTRLSRRIWRAGEEGAGEGEEEKRGPVIALHVRLGDKASEYEHDSKEMGITNTFGNLTVYIEAAHDHYRRLIPSRYPPLSLTQSTSSPTPPRFSPYARPSLLLISAEPLPPLLSSLSHIPLAGPFKILVTPAPDVRAEGVREETKVRLEEQQRVEKEAEEKGGSGKGPKAYVAAAATAAEEREEGGKMVKINKVSEPKYKRSTTASPPLSPPPPAADLSTGYLQSAFNALPLLERVVHTQAFVRDLTIIAREVDAAVVSGASNVGRLGMLIAGKEAVTGPSSPEGHSLGGRIRSVDAHFYPTAYSSAVYSQIQDVEDTEHAAFVPEEWHRKEEEAKEAKRKGKKKKGKGEGKGEGKGGEKGKV
ncbi:hypothetical protein JCM11251_003194 [Rhodosporidiobolus azoricus]